MSHPEAFQVVAAILGMMVAVSMWMQASLVRNARCRHCDHCRKITQAEEAKRAEARHHNYHMLTDRAPSACRDKDCKGR